MEITLEKIELVKDRTGVSYKEAKEALEANDGSVVDAIINIEETIDTGTKRTLGEQGTAIVENVKELINKGNVSKIIVKDRDDETILNMPVNVGLVATVVAPWGMLAGALASVGFKCTVEIVKTDGTIIDVSSRANEAMGKAVEMGSEFADAAKTKGGEVYDKMKNSEAYEKVNEKIEEALEKTSEAIKETINKVKGESEDKDDMEDEDSGFEEKAYSEDNQGEVKEEAKPEEDN